MTTHAFARRIPGVERHVAHATADASAHATTRAAAPRRSLMILALCFCAGAGALVGAQDGRDDVAASRALAGTRATSATIAEVASGTRAIDGARDALHGLGIRKVALCDAACTTRASTAAHRIADDRPQAVIVSATSDRAAAFVHDLRQAGSSAMVVLAGPADPAEVVRRLPDDERRWLAAVRDTGSMSVAIVGRNGRMLD